MHATPVAVQRAVEADLRRREPRPTLQVVLGMLAFLTAAGVGGGLVGQALGLAPGLAVEGLAVLACYPVLVRWLTRRPVYELSAPGALRELASGAGLGTAYMVLVVAVVWALGGYHVTAVGWDRGFLTGLMLGIGPGIAEEIAFRGILLRVLDKPLGSIWALALTSTLFGAVHLANPDATVWGAVAIAAEAGVPLGAAYLLTRRLWFAIGLHAAWNAVEGGIFGIDVSGSGSGRGLVESTMSGPAWLSGGAMGIEGSVVAVVVGLGLGAWLLALARRRGHVLPARQRTAPVLDMATPAGVAG